MLESATDLHANEHVDDNHQRWGPRALSGVSVRALRDRLCAAALAVCGVLTGGVHRSTRELVTAIKDFLAITNEQPKPFVWTKTADQILESVARFCKRTSDSGHSVIAAELGCDMTRFSTAGHAASWTGSYRMHGGARTSAIGRYDDPEYVKGPGAVTRKPERD